MVSQPDGRDNVTGKGHGRAEHVQGATPHPIDGVDGGLPHSARQEQFSIAFVHMVASAAGCSIKHHSTDYDGVDITIASSAQYETVFGPQFELQLKCTTQQHL